MKNAQTITGTLEIIKRLPSSYFGNPRYLLSVGGVECCTSVNAMLAYSITNHEGKQVEALIGLYRGKSTIETVKAI